MTKIEWTEQTWNPIVGCSIVSPGCTNCYAMGVAATRLDAEDQKRADERVPDLLATPAAVRFVSAEPLLGPIDFTRIAPRDGRHIDALAGAEVWADETYSDEAPKLDWIIVGGESGRGARPMRELFNLKFNQ